VFNLLPNGKRFRHNVALDLIEKFLDIHCSSQFIDDEFAPFSASQMRKVNKRSKELWDWFIQVGIIEYDGKGYEVGVHARRYRIAFKYLEGEFISPESKPSRVPKNLKQYHEGLEGVKIDLESAKRAIWERFNEEGGESDYKAILKRLRALKIVEEIARGEWRLFRDGTVNRLYSNLTFLPKYLRKYLHYAKEPLVQLDVSNSHPLILTGLIRLFFVSEKVGEEGWRAKMKLALSTNYIQEITNNNPTPNTPNHYVAHFAKGAYLCCPPHPKEQLKQALQVAENEKELKRFTDLCRDGELYHFISERMEWEQEVAWSIRKKQVKELFFTYLYSRKRAKVNTIMRKEFPFIADCVEVLKSKTYMDKGKVKVQLAVELMKVESAIMIDGALQKLLRNESNSSFGSIHDAVICTKEKHLIVEESVQNCWLRTTGGRCKLELKELNH
jgi:hypothetical protein